MKLTRLLSFSLFTALILAAGVALAAPRQKIPVLILTGDDVSPAHDWKSVSAATRGILEATGKFDVTVAESVAALDDASALNKFKVIYLAMYNAKTPPPTDAGKQNLVDFVNNGGGFVVSHLSSASFKDWPEFRQLCGRYWVMGKSGHGPRAPFTVKIEKSRSPITKGITDYQADDELYAKLEGDGPINVLATADSDWSKKNEPLVFTLKHGKGRVFHHAFGHDARALEGEQVRTILARGTQWAATGRVR